MHLRRELAVAAYRTDGDRASAAARLELMVDELVESTRSEQLDGLADLAAAFAAIGNVERARPERVNDFAPRVVMNLLCRAVS